jgi:hypothetical protein
MLLITSTLTGEDLGESYKALYIDNITSPVSSREKFTKELIYCYSNISLFCMLKYSENMLL